MFIGQHKCKIDSQGYIYLPKPHMEILERDRQNGRRLLFVPMVTLNIYTQTRGQELIDALLSAGDDDLVWKEATRRLARITQGKGWAAYTGSGKVRIPEDFMKMYGLSNGMEITVCGFVEYIGLLNSPGLKDI